MRSSLFDYEWQFLTQMITRIHYTCLVYTSDAADDS